MTIINEAWRSIAGYINYQVSNVGGVRNAKTERILKQAFYTLRHRTINYYGVSLTNDAGKKTWSVHRLVAREF